MNMGLHGTRAHVGSTPYRTTVSPCPRVSVVIGTYGSSEWDERGEWLARKMYDRQGYPDITGENALDVEVINVHARTLADARNHGANLARARWLVFLDADDYLDDDYSWTITQTDEVDVLCPMVQGFRADWSGPRGGYANWRFIEGEPVRPKVTSLIKQNYLPCGAAVRKDLFFHVGGFDEWPVLEDWAFWLKCEQAGAKFGEMDSTYFINDDHQRSRYPDSDRIAREIRKRYQ